MSGNQFKTQPLNLYQVTDATGNADAFRISTADGTAAGTIASSTTSIFSSANELKTVPTSFLVVRNKDDTQDVLKINTASKGAEVITLSHGGAYVLNVDATNGLKLQDDKIEVKPSDTFDIKGIGGSPSVLKIDNTPGSGSEILTLKAHTVNGQEINSKHNH